MSTSVFLVALCLMVTMVVAQTSPSKKQCLSKGTSTWTACTDNKMNQTFTSTFTGCSTDPLVQVLNCTYSKTKASKKRDCAKTIMDDLTTCATGAIFNRTYSEAGTQCKVRKQTAKKSTEMDCNKFYKVKGEKVKGEKKAGKKASKKAKRINRKSKRIGKDENMN
ncbi:uncharacterized protein LOC128238296 [Mya arenaria]|uniref:uncharacterized protein LOC128238296 n=1 Tax=Mya arenaria TaxID=6604 RepID=UPI0022E6F5F6|nr:uncharacterized protein LOC128238296 [Mya arenaria]